MEDAPVALLRVVDLGRKIMSDREDHETKEETLEEVKDDRLYKDDDIMRHAQKLVLNYLEQARHQDFEVSINYTDLKLIADAVSLSISRTEQVNKIADAFNKRMELVSNHAQHLQNIASLKLKNETN